MLQAIGKFPRNMAEYSTQGTNPAFAPELDGKPRVVYIMTQGSLLPLSLTCCQFPPHVHNHLPNTSDPNGNRPHSLDQILSPSWLQKPSSTAGHKISPLRDSWTSPLECNTSRSLNLSLDVPEKSKWNHLKYQATQLCPCSTVPSITLR